MSNGGWIDSNTADGVRLSLAEDYSDIYIFNLRGNQRTAGEQSRKEGGKVFGSGSRNTVAIFIGIKQAGTTGCTIHYRNIGDYLSAEKKLETIDNSTIDNIKWETISPNQYGDWINQRSEDFETWPVLGDKKQPLIPRIFENYSLGLATGRDSWCYSPTSKQVSANIDRLLNTYEEARGEFFHWLTTNGITRPKEAEVNHFLRENPEFADTTRISWNSNLKNDLALNRNYSAIRIPVVSSLHRPFSRQQVAFDRSVNARVYQLPSMFPTPQHDNIGIVLAAPAERSTFAVSSTDQMIDLNFYSVPGQLFSRWNWQPTQASDGELDFSDGNAATSGAPGTAGEVLDGYRRVDNITDEIHTIYREALGDDVAKDGIFYFVYGQLHDPGYREAYAADLKKMLPHIETPTDRARFNQLATAGKELMDLHINYENVEPWPLDIQIKPTVDTDDRETWRVTKLKWAKVRDPETNKLVNDVTTMIYNPKVTIGGIPVEADEYMLGSRSALAWIIDRYQVKKDKASGIINDPNDWADEVDDPRYIVDLIAKVTRTAVETNRIVASIDSRQED